MIVLIIFYLIGFFFTFYMEASCGPVTVGLAALRALVWPWYFYSGRPKGIRYPMD